MFKPEANQFANATTGRRSIAAFARYRPRVLTLLLAALVAALLLLVNLTGGITIRWPSGRVETLHDVSADQIVRVVEGQGVVLK
jgi:hypothetical protein